MSKHASLKIVQPNLFDIIIVNPFQWIDGLKILKSTEIEFLEKKKWENDMISSMYYYLWWDLFSLALVMHTLLSHGKTLIFDTLTN